MNASRSLPDLHFPNQAELDWLLSAGIDIMTLIRPEPMRVAIGCKADDGLFESHAAGDRWLVFEERTTGDMIFWQPKRWFLASWSGRAFALGEDVIDELTTYSLDAKLSIYGSPIDWLRHRREGIVVMPQEWPRAFDRLRDVPRVAIAEALLPLYRRHMRPAHLPKLFVVTERRRAV